MKDRNKGLERTKQKKKRRNINKELLFLKKKTMLMGPNHVLNWTDNTLTNILRNYMAG